MDIKIKNLDFYYGKQQILHNISCEIISGEMFIIIGANGSGKTTLLRCISGVQKSQSSMIYLGMKDLVTMTAKEIAQYLSALEPQIDAGFDYSVEEIVSLGRISFTTSAEENAKIVVCSMEQAGVIQFAKRSIFELSSGERQRVWLAMATAQQPKILVLDEPTSYLDIKYQLQILDLMHTLTTQGMTVIATIHDLSLVAQYATRIALLKNGKIIALDKPSDVLTEEKLQQAFDTKVYLLRDEDNIIGVIPQRCK